MSGTSAFGKWKEKLKAGRVAEIVVAVILCVIVIAVVYSLLAGDDEKQAAAAETYAQQVEKELADVLSQLEGAGNVSVFVSVANEGETVIAMETTVASDGTTTTSPVFVGGDVVVLEERKPAIAGVLIVADGADSITVRSRLIDAAASALDIDQSRIKVYAKEGR